MKQKITFPCCHITAFGFRGAHIVGSDIWRYAQCPKCGKRHNLEPLPHFGPIVRPKGAFTEKP